MCVKRSNLKKVPRKQKDTEGPNGQQQKQRHGVPLFYTFATLETIKILSWGENPDNHQEKCSFKIFAVPNQPKIREQKSKSAVIWLPYGVYCLVRPDSTIWSKKGFMLAQNSSSRAAASWELCLGLEAVWGCVWSCVLGAVLRAGGSLENCWELCVGSCA